MNFRLLTPMAWVAVVASLVVASALAWYLVIGRPAQMQQAGAIAKVGRAQAQGRVLAGTDAVGINDAAHDTAALSEQLTRDHADAIRNMPGAAQPLDRGLNRAGRSKLCERAAYRGSAECMQQPDRAQSPR